MEWMGFASHFCISRLLSQEADKKPVLYVCVGISSIFSGLWNCFYVHLWALVWVILLFWPANQRWCTWRRRRCSALSRSLLCCWPSWRKRCRTPSRSPSPTASCPWVLRRASTAGHICSSVGPKSEWFRSHTDVFRSVAWLHICGCRHSLDCWVCPPPAKT